MPRTKHGLPGIYNATPITLDDGEGAAPALNATGQLVVAAPTGTSSNAVQGTAADNAAAVGNPVLVAGYYESGTDTYADGDVAKLHTDANGNLKVTNATLSPGQDLANDVTKVEQRFSYAHISTSTTTTVKSGAGFLHNVTIGTLGTVASTTTIYDNTAGSGTVIGVINSLTLGGTFTFDVTFATGLTFVTTGTAAPDITVSYR